ncbi:hypothetical protein FS837_009315, partial [Tulasnella sp. UAMH 9824]
MLNPTRRTKRGTTAAPTAFGKWTSREWWLRKREREYFWRMEIIRPSSFHHYQSHHFLGRPLSQVVPTHTEADHVLLFPPNQPPLPQYRQSGTSDYESLEHGEAEYQTATFD